MKETHEEAIVQELVRQFKALRLQKALSHKKLAEIAGVTRPAISQIESGKRRPTLIVCLKLAHALEENLGEILARCERNVRQR